MRSLRTFIFAATVAIIVGFCVNVLLAQGAQTAARIQNGGTGTSTAPAYGQVLVGGLNGEYEYAATSTFGGAGSGAVTSVFGRTGAVTAQSGDYTTSLVPEGTNLYWTNTRFDNRLSATTSLPNITTLSGLSLPYSQLTGTPDLTQYFTLSAWYGTTTDQLREGTNNLYFTNGRADARFVADLAATSSVASITTLGNLSLPVGQLSGTLGVAHGGTGSTTLTGILKGNGTGQVVSAIGDIDYQKPITLTTNGTSGAATFSGDTLNIPQYAGTTYSAAFPVTLNGSIFGFAGLSTSTNAVQGNVPYFSGANTFANEATGTISQGTGISVTGAGYDLGSGITIANTGVISNSCPGGFLSCSGTNPSSFTLGTLGISNGGTGTTTAPVSQLLYGGSGGVYQSVATSSASCGSGVSCSGFTVVGSVSPSITLTSNSFNTSLSGILGDNSVALGGTLHLTSELSTSSVPTVSQIPYVTNAGTPTQLGFVSTSSGSCSGGASCSSFTVLGSSGPTISVFSWPWITATNYGTTTSSTTTVPWYKLGLTASSTSYLANATTSLLTITGQAAASGQNCLQIDTTGFVSKTGGACGSGGSVTSITNGGGLDFSVSPITTSGTITAQVGTSSVPTQGNLAYWTGNGTPSTLGTVATTTLQFSGPFTGATSLGALVGGSNSTVTWTGLSTTSQPASSNLLASNGGAGVYGVGTSSESCSSATGISCTSFNVVGGGGSLSLSSIPNSSLANSSITVNTSYPLGGGGSVSLGNSLSLTYSGLGTSSPWTQGQLAEISNTNTIFGVSTSSLGVIGPITFSGTMGAQVGGAGGNFGCTIASSGVTGCLSGTDYTTFNNKIGWGQATSTSANQVVYTDALGKLTSIASSSLNLPNSALQNSTISGVSLGSNLNSVTFNNGGAGAASGQTYNGSGAVTVSYNTIGAQVAGNYDTFAWPFSPTTFGGAAEGTTTILYPTGLAVGSSTIGSLTASSSIANQSVKSALVLNSATGLEGAYGGSNPCSNQVAFSISATGVISCTSVTNAMLSNSTMGITAGLGLNGGGTPALGGSATLNLQSYLATSSGETDGNVAYWTTTNGTPAKFGSVATSSITCNGGTSCGAGSYVIGNALTITGTPFSFSPQSDGNATSTELIFKNGFLSTASSTINGNATTTGYLSAGTLYLPNISGTQCLHETSGVVSGTGSDCGSGGGGAAYPFTPSTFGTVAVSATSTALQDYAGGIFATSTIGSLTASSSAAFPFISTGPLAVNSSGALISAGSGTSGNCVQWGANNTLGDAGSTCGTGSSTVIPVATSTAETRSSLAYWTTSGATPEKLASIATTTLTLGSEFSYSGTIGALVGGAAGTLHITNNGVSNAMLANSTISGVSLGGTLNNFSVGSDFTGTSYNGSASVSDWALKMSQPHDWTGLQTFTNASSTLMSVLTLFAGNSATSTFWNDGRIGLASSSPSFLWGLSAATTTMFMNTQFGGSIASSTSASASYTVIWESGNTQRFILNQNTNIIINATSSYPRDGFRYTLKLCQDPVGSRTATFVTPGQLIWEGGNGATTTISSAASSVTLIGMIYDARVQRYDIVASTTKSDARSCVP